MSLSMPQEAGQGTLGAESLNTNTEVDAPSALNTLDTVSSTSVVPEAERMARFGLSTQPRPPKTGTGAKSFIDIQLDSPYLTLKGTGPDVEATRLSGNVVLYLAEASSIREITLEFRGKAKIPVPGQESVINTAASLTYNVCNHSWSFLDLGTGSKRVAYRTLKAGRHLFPFSLEIGGSLPSSISTPVLGGASVSYKLHALATRPHKVSFSFSFNLHHVTPVTIIRAFNETALEYQQTLEIENTWPGKLMYSIVLPHKAWAQGDTLGALVKFSPTAKGVTVHSILTNIEERIKVYARSGAREDMRVVAAAKHEIEDGKRAVLVDTNRPSLWIGHASPPRTPLRTPAIPTSNQAGPSSRPMDSIPPDSPPADYFTTPDTSADPSAAPTDIVSTLYLPIPKGAPAIQPSHTLEPITITHRVRWSIYISNPDGHISELRCSLPIVILDGRLLREARGYTAMARRSVLTSGGLVAGAFGAGPSTAGGEGADGEGEEGETLELEAEDRELPSYHAHVRDRVANMYLPEGSTMRVSNPWVTQRNGPTAYVHPMTSPLDGVFPGNFTPVPDTATGDDGRGTPHGSADSPRDPEESVQIPRTSSAPNLSSIGQPPRNPYVTPPTTNPPSRQPRSGAATPSEFRSPNFALSHLPPTPGAGSTTPLDWVNSELLLSLSDEPGRRFEREIEISRVGANGTGSGGGSSVAAVSRAGSPVAGRRSRGPSRPLSPVSAGSSNGHPPHSPHPGQHHKPGLTGFFKGAMKGFGFTKHHSDEHGRESLPRTSFSSSSRPTSRRSSPVRRSSDHARSRRPSPTRTNTSSGSNSIAPIIPPDSLPSPAPTRPTNLQMTSTPTSGQSLSRTGSNHSGSSPSGMRSPGGILPYTPISGGPSRPTSPGLARTGDTQGNEALLHRAFTEVPDYSVAARGFLGGVAPLSSQAGLPSYDDVTREREREGRERQGASS
ncbi:hypothetical protein BKA70DRAFT_1287402 [Coprinopsis sp. MPI-PUGE-AT-0042]|nr:hypothetical protein BKA70DRAFT_1287402 [Coprinopsis sp. MPI-PUGE-AT-0042]